MVGDGGKADGGFRFGEAVDFVFLQNSVGILVCGKASNSPLFCVSNAAEGSGSDRRDHCKKDTAGSVQRRIRGPAAVMRNSHVL